ncbi:MAG TPA: hypothetical protein VKA10_06080, partial [Prolixibacteraceae bacterium]|nr:hypothetical protein [Prolixibacteraceae bacterium]
MINFKDKISTYIIYLSVLIAFSIILTSQDWNKKNMIIGADVISYYAYLPATFIFNDIKLEKEETLKYGIFWPEITPDGAKVIKTTMGLSILYSPFFLAAHAVAKIAGLEAYGYSPIYKIGLLISALFYFLAGLLFLRKILKNWFSENVTAVVLLSIAIGTNLLYYTTREASMSHVYNFFLFNAFMWVTIKWYNSPNFGLLISIGALAGLIALARPSNIIILLFFLLYDVYSKKTLLKKAKFIFSKFHWFIFMGLAFIAVWIPQMLYWKSLTDNFFFYSYTTERFFFNNPHFIDGLFSFRKGWLVYTPIMAFSLIGIVFTFKRLKEVSVAITVFTIVNMYIIFSWWCWWYGGSFGMRPMIDSYGLLAIPMAALLSSLSNFRKYLFKITVGVCFFLIFQNFFFMRKYRSGSIHWDSM